jgi:hypothetical protein
MKAYAASLKEQIEELTQRKQEEIERVRTELAEV